MNGCSTGHRALRGAARSGDRLGARAPSVMFRVRPSFPPRRGHKARSLVGSSWGSGAPRAEPSAGLRGLQTLRGSGSFVPRAEGARHAARWRGLGGPGRGRSLAAPPPSPGVASGPATRRPQPAPTPGLDPSFRARPRPSLLGRARPAASPAARARLERAPTCGQQCALGFRADRIWRFCTLQRRLLRPRRFCLRWSWWGGGSLGQRRTCSYSGSRRRGPLGPFAACCLEAGPLVLSLCAPSPRSSLAQQPAWWEGRGRRVGSDPHLRGLLGPGARTPWQGLWGDKSRGPCASAPTD